MASDLPSFNEQLRGQTILFFLEGGAVYTEKKLVLGSRIPLSGMKVKRNESVSVIFKDTQ